MDSDTLKLMRVVDEIYTEYPFFGTRMMADYLKLHGYGAFGRAKIRTIYEHLGLRAACPGPHTSVPHPAHKVYPYLLRNVEITHCNHVWSTDITYIRLRHGFVYLIAIIDWFSRFVLDWQVSKSLDADFCIEILARVLKTGKCDIFNKDQGYQFKSEGFTGLLFYYCIRISMDGKGRALDNVFVERLWRSLKYECIYLHDFDTIKDVYQKLIEYFEFYNYNGPNKSLNGKTPVSIYLSK